MTTYTLTRSEVRTLVRNGLDLHGPIVDIIDEFADALFDKYPRHTIGDPDDVWEAADRLAFRYVDTDVGVVPGQQPAPLFDDDSPEYGRPETGRWNHT